MVSKSPEVGLFPFRMAVLWLINGGDPHHLQVLDDFDGFRSFFFPRDRNLVVQGWTNPGIEKYARRNGNLK